MATKKICDRCGAEINPRASMTHVELSDFHFQPQRHDELCVSCAFRLRKWLNEKEETV